MQKGGDNMSLTNKLNMLMKERNISKSDLAHESGIPYTTIDGIFRKSENAKLSTLKKLCSYFDCTLDFLTNDSIEKPTTIAEYLNCYTYTDEELEKIKDFAMFLKSNRK